MKKFLSLALALIMVLSLVTISAGATEYEDFTDKDEIQYEEAVAVLNKLGIITGYEEGDFRPEGELTRGAAAKIIVSLLIGPEAAQNLPTTANPYPDVPAGNVFAGVISYCKNENIIAGYKDGTFRPTGTLTGYAFAKMLLGALGFDSDIEGFTGSGWTMRVATLGNTAGLFDRISFKGGETVNRETACQLALNTLKATTVEYNGSGSTSITIAGVPVDIGGTQKWSYRTSNQDFATNIKANDAGNGDNDRNLSDWYTVEFGEEHFVDLRLDRNKYNPIEDEYGRPCVQWSYKRISIGKYPLEPDFSFTKQVIHALEDTSDASKLNALGMNGYNVDTKDGQTQFYVNGEGGTVDRNGNVSGTHGYNLAKTADIADYTDNGAQVYAYVSYKQGQSDVLSHVVVIQSQLMEVKKVGSDYVSLQMYDNDESDSNKADGYDVAVSGYNQMSINYRVADVEVGDDYYTLLSGMKAGDLVVVEPYTSDHSGNSSSYEVGRAYVPETVTGVFSHVTTHGTKTENRKAIALTVGGTKYSISQWNKDLNTAGEEELKVTKKDVTLYLDQFGYPMLGKDIGGTTDWMVVSGFRQAMQNGYLVNIVNGYNLDGEEIELNVGPAKSSDTTLSGIHEGDLVHYQSSNKSTTDWEISMDPNDASGVYDVFTGQYTPANGDPARDYELSTGNSRIMLYDFTNGGNPVGEVTETYPGTDKDPRTASLAIQEGVMKFIFVSFDDDHEVSGVEILTTKQNVNNSDLKVTCADGNGTHGAQACVKTSSDGTTRTVKAVVIKRESNNNDNLPIGQIDKYLEDITDTTKTAASVQNDGLTGSNVQYANNRVVYRYTATLRSANGSGADRQVDVYSYQRLEDGDYFTWSKTEHETYENFYTLHRIGDETVQRTRTVLNAEVWGQVNGDKNMLLVGDYMYTGNAVKAYPWLATQRTYTELNGGEWANVVNIARAVISDKTKNGIESVNDLNDWFADKANEGKYLEIRMLVNDNPTNDGFRDVYMLTIESENAKKPISVTNPPVYASSIETKKLSENGDPGLDPSEAEKYSVTVSGNGWEEVVIGSDVFTSDNIADLAAKKYPTGTVVKVKPLEGVTIEGMEPVDGYYLWTVGTENLTITVNKTGTSTSEEGNVVDYVDSNTEDTVYGNAELGATVETNGMTDLVLPTDEKMGGVILAFDINRSATASGASATTGGRIHYSLYVDGTNILTSSVTFTRSDKRVLVNQGTPVTHALIDGTKDVEVRVTKVAWDNLRVEYREKGSTTVMTTEELGKYIDTSKPYTTEVLADKATADKQPFSFTIVSRPGTPTTGELMNGSSFTVLLSGAAEDSTTKLNGSTTNAINPTQTAFSCNITTQIGTDSEYTEPIVLTFDGSGMKYKEAEYTVTAPEDAIDLNSITGSEVADATDDTYEVTLTVAPATVTPSANTAIVTATLTTELAKTTKPVRITVEAEEDPNINTTILIKNDADGSNKAFVGQLTGIDKDVTLKISKVEVVSTPKFAQITMNKANGETGAWAANDTITIWFDSEIEDGSANGTAAVVGSGKLINAAAGTASGKSLTFNVGGAATAGDTFTVVDVETSEGLFCTQTITVTVETATSPATAVATQS